jgi:hypothetical protein
VFIESGGVDRDCDLVRERSIRSGIIPPYHLVGSELNRAGSVLPSDGGRGDLARGDRVEEGRVVVFGEIGVDLRES